MAITKWGSVSFPDPVNGTKTTVTIYADKKFDADNKEGVEFTLKVEGNSGDLLGFFIDFKGSEYGPTKTFTVDGQALGLRQDEDNILWAGTRANNMNGTAANAKEGAIADDGYDIGVQLSDPGASDGNLAERTFFISNISLNNLDGQRFGIRLQNTLNEEGSLKLEGTFDEPDLATFQGLSHGYWKNHGPVKPGEGQGEGWFNDWDNDSIDPESKDPVTGKSKLVFEGNSATSFESFFGVDITWDIPGTGQLEDVNLQDALGLTGGGLNALAREATAAVLNRRDENIQFYKYTEGQIVLWTQQAFTGVIPDIDGDGSGDWANNAEAITGLKNLFEQQNTLNLQTII
jgi:hypothetical protein